MAVFDVMKKLLNVPVMIAGVLSVSLMTGCEKGQSVPMRAPEVCVEAVKAERAVLVTEIAGRTSPYRVAEVRPQVSGIIKSRNFTEGADVKAGQTLYQIDPDTYQAQYESAKAALERAEANLTPLRLKTKRFAELVKINAVSRQDLEDINAAFKQAQAEVNIQKAAVRTAKIRLNYTRVNAPISGRVGISTVTAGALVGEYQGSALTTVQQLDPMYVDITQSSVEMLKLRRAFESGRLTADAGGSPVRLQLEDGTEYAHAGKLQFTDVTIDRTSGMVTLRALFPNPEKILLPNMYVRARIIDGVDDNAVLVPVRALMRDVKGNASVFIVSAENKVVPVPIVANRLIGDRWLVEKGLNIGDRVVIEGLQRLRPGMTVTVVDKPTAQNK